MSKDGGLLVPDLSGAADSRARNERDGDDGGPLGSSDLWAAFVEARDHYRRVSLTRAYDFAAVVEAREDMNEAYRRWSES